MAHGLLLSLMHENDTRHVESSSVVALHLALWSGKGGMMRDGKGILGQHGLLAQC